MATNLLDSLKDLVTPELLSSASRNLGETQGAVATGLGASFASILTALAGKAGNPQVMRPLFDLITSPANDGSVLRDPRLAAAAPPDSPIWAAGGTLLSALFGPQLSSVANLITGTTGVRSSSGTSLLSMAAPLVLGLLGDRVRSGSLNLAGLSSLLLGERSQLMRAAPAGLGSLLGLTDLGKDVDVTAPRVSTPDVPRLGRRWLWPALAALALLAVVWAISRRGRPDTREQTVGAISEATSPLDSDPSPAAAATAATGSTLPANVVDATWQWVSYTTPVEQIQVDGPDRYTIRFGQDGRVALKADCNRGKGAFSVGPDNGITFKPIALTRAMCPPGSLSDRFAKEVGRATSYFMKDGDLFLELPIDSGTLRFRREA